MPHSYGMQTRKIHIETECLLFPEHSSGCCEYQAETVYSDIGHSEIHEIRRVERITVDRLQAVI